MTGIFIAYGRGVFLKSKHKATSPFIRPFIHENYIQLLTHCLGAIPIDRAAVRGISFAEIRGNEGELNPKESRKESIW